MASWDFNEEQSDEKENWDKDKSYKDQYGNIWVYGRRGWRILGDYDS